jgi:hypothetical protein
MEYKIPTTTARFRLFDESVEALTPFKMDCWRGCALDHDRYDHTRMPRDLFEAIVDASAPSELLIERFAPDNTKPDVISADWTSFRDHMFSPDNWCLEFVLFDASERWAVLADADLIVVGAAAELAEEIDVRLKARGISLVDLTNADFPVEDREPQRWAAYLSAIVGR